MHDLLLSSLLLVSLSIDTDNVSQVLLTKTTLSSLYSQILFCCLIFYRPNIVYVASNHFVWRLVPVSISSQIRQLLQDKQFELALQLAVSVTSPLNLVIKFFKIQLVL